MTNLYLFESHLDQIECDMIKKWFESQKEIKKLETVVNGMKLKSENLRGDILKKYPLLNNVIEYRDSLKSEYVCYINSKHQSVQSHD